MILQDLAKILVRPWQILQDLAKILFQTNLGKILARSWQEYACLNLGKILPRFVGNKILPRSCRDLTRSGKILPRCSTWVATASPQHTKIMQCRNSSSTNILQIYHLIMLLLLTEISQSDIILSKHCPK